MDKTSSIQFATTLDLLQILPLAGSKTFITLLGAAVVLEY